MLRNRKMIAGGLLLLMLAGFALARTATAPPSGQRIYDMKWLNINKWLCPFHNDGRYGYDPTRGNGEAGGSWPQPYKNMYIFGAGLWFGSLKPRGDDRVDTLVTFGYNPNSGGSEMSPFAAKDAPAGAGDQNDRVYMFPNDWPPPTDRWPDAYAEGLVPDEAFSLQDMWCVYSDLGEDNHIAPGYPQEIEVYQTIYAWNYPSNQDIFFILYKVRNAGDDTLKACYMGALMDPDVGEHADDMVGTLLNDSVAGVGWVQNVGFVGDNDNIEVQNARGQWEEGTPGVVAYKFLESPKDPEGDPLGMTAFKKFTIDIDPVTDQAQYLTMAGYDYRTGVFSPYDSVDVAPADKRFVQCSGPFDLAPGQVEVLIVACIAAPYGEEGESWESRRTQPYNVPLVDLAIAANSAQFIYDQGWLLPGPPVSPNITLVPGDNQVRIVWDNISETTPDAYWEKVAGDTSSSGYDPKYLGYDFQGYVVYKSRGGSEWSILTQCDRADSIIFDYPPGGDSAIADSLWIRADDGGITYTFVDDDVYNGYEYFYCATAYDWNYSTTERDSMGNPIAWDTLILRSGIVANWSTVPRWNPTNFQQPTTEVVTTLGDTANPGMTVTSEVVVPFEVTADAHELKFLAPKRLADNRTRYEYIVTNTTADTVVLDTAGFSYTVGAAKTVAAPIFNGQAMTFDIEVETPSQGFDTVYVVTGDYPAEKLRSSITAQQGLWAFRGADYRIEWETMEGGYLTARVYDVTHGDMEVPYGAFYTRVQGETGPQHANGWCFANRLFQPTDTLKTGSAQVFICGEYFTLNYNSETQRGDTIGASMSMIGDGDVWMAMGYKAGGTTPFYNTYELVSTPGEEFTDTLQTLNVKVVPNPYVVFNSWESNSDSRMVKFTHLPMNCTIRIFTLAGDLVKVLEHQHDGEQPHDQGGTESWDFLNSNDQLIASGVYIFHVESEVGECTGKFVIIH